MSEPATKAELALVAGQVCVALQAVASALIAVHRGNPDNVVERMDLLQTHTEQLFTTFMHLKSGE